MHILDSQISRALAQPTPWEVAQWREAALADKAEWSKLIDVAGSHRFCDEVQRSVDQEIRRERMWCGPAPSVVAAAPVPSELARSDYYSARNLFSWVRLDYRSEAGGKVTALGEKVALVAEGAVAANARSVDPAHSYAQADNTKQVPSVATSALINSSEVGTFNGAHYYPSTIAASNWTEAHNGTGFEAWAAYVPTVVSNACVWGTSPAGATQGAVHYAYAAGDTVNGAVFGAGGSSAYTSGNVGSAPINSPTFTDFLISSGGCSFWQKSSLLHSGALTSPSASAPTSTMTIGSISSASAVLPLRALLAEVRFSKAPSTTLRTATRRAFLLRYALS